MTAIPLEVLRAARQAALELPWCEDDTALLLAAINNPAVLDEETERAA